MRDSSPCPIPKIMPELSCALTSCTICTQSATLVAMGFSQRMWYPSLLHAATTWAWRPSCLSV